MATGSPDTTQPDSRLSNWNGGSHVSYEGYTKDELKKIADKVSIGGGYDKKYITSWNIQESSLSEANINLGPKAKKFDSYIQEWDFFTDADNNKLREERLPKEWHDALKKLGVKADDAIVLFFAAHGDRQEVLDIAKKSGIKYIEVPEGDDGGSGGIIFSAKL